MINVASALKISPLSISARVFQCFFANYRLSSGVIPIAQIAAIAAPELVPDTN